MHLRGPVVEVGEPKTVSTRYGERDLCEVLIRPDDGCAESVRVTL